MTQIPRLYLTAICNSNRTEAISILEACIQKYGSIFDFSLFSDVSLALVIEINSADIPRMIHELESTLLFNESLDAIQSMNYHVYLNVTFTLGTGNMKHEIPEVPG